MNTTVIAILTTLLTFATAGIVYVLHLCGGPCTCGRPCMDCDGHGPHHTADREPDPDEEAALARDFAATVAAGHLTLPDWGTARTTPHTASDESENTR